MKESKGVSKIFKTLKKNIRSLRLGTVGSLKKIESASKKLKDKPLLKLTKEQKKDIEAKFNDIDELTGNLQKELANQVKHDTAKLKSEIEN
ncbi:MAG: hypothetical protein QM734_12930 [Cyclobacteriaceae bacterium]